MSDRRDQQLHFRVSKLELERIRSKMAELGILSIGAAFQAGRNAFALILMQCNETCGRQFPSPLSSLSKHMLPIFCTLQIKSLAEHLLCFSS